MTTSALVVGIGQVGTFAAEGLAASGATVSTADLSPSYGYFHRYAPSVHGAPSQIDLSDTKAVPKLFKSSPDVVVVSAGVVGEQCERDPALAWRVNVEGLRSVAASAVRAGVQRLVFVSSLAVYGRTGAETVTENSPLAPQSEYGRTKAAAEVMLSDFRATGLDVRVVRPCGIYGPLRIGRGSQSARRIERVVLAAARDNRVVLEASPMASEQYLYVKDLARAITAVALSKKSDGSSTTYNVAPARATTVAELAAAIECVFEGVEISIRTPDQLEPGPARSEVDASLIGRELGVSPEFDLQRGLQDYVDEARLA